ncbi:hypothetical protein [Gelidibacter salicanalis]|uniref:Uncharacterized protein n=1 Tax=Gelidibacter salicanalis TaxID=291193 RepID=A0A934NHK7_9FLAO|nr:hypothetical protein [Gelidibacter salicanalis]MBJ7880981.1 hypothetical protein [Gelidibacter salicanalis]
MFTLEVLDSILASFHKETTHKKYFKTIEILLYQNIIYKNKLTHLMIEKSLEKLISDNYVVKITSETLTKDSTDIFTYELTWEGNFFLFQGGYMGEYYRENEEKQRLIKVEKEQLTNAQKIEEQSKKMTSLTRVLVVLTAVASLYYLMEIGRFLYPHLYKYF